MMATARRLDLAITELETDEISIPPLENGDHLSQQEFERRYDAMPDLKKAELIEGVVFMGSPVSMDRHGDQHNSVSGWLSYYRSATRGTKACNDGSIRLSPKSMFQPDVCLRILPECGGQARLDHKGYLVGGPELAIEVASSTVSQDLHAKLEAYRSNGVKEYLVWRVRDGAFDWFILRDGAYTRLDPSPDGLLKSETFPGLWLDAEALIRDDMAAVFRTLQLGLATPEHAAFVARLADGDRLP